MRYVAILGVLCLLLASCGDDTATKPAGEGGDIPSLGEEEVARLVDEAVACPIRLWDTVRKLGAKILMRDSRGPHLTNLTLAAYLFGAEGRLDEEDFQSVANVQVVARAFFPMREPGSRVPRHLSASIAHPEYVVGTTVEVTGREARGVVHVKAPDVFEGRVHYEAAYADGGWQVMAVSFPRSEVRFTREGGSWKLQPSARVRSPNPLRGTALTLARVSEVGNEPASDRIVLSVDRDGMTRIQGYPRPRDLFGLRSELQMLTADPGTREEDRSSRVHVILDVDESVPFLACVWLLQLCTDPTIAIYRVYLGARADSGEEGAIALYLPRDQGRGVTPPLDDPTEVKLEMTAARGHATTPRALLARLQQIPAKQWEELPLELVVATEEAAAVPHGAVMRILDVARRAGVRRVHLATPGLPPLPRAETSDRQALAEHLDKLRALGVGPSLSLGGEPIQAAPPDAPELPAGRRVDEVLGFGLD